MDVQLHQRSQDCIAQGALTNSKRPESFVKGVYPTHLMRGNGCHVWDTQGKKYIDFICGLGSSILGYANTSVTAAAFVGAKAGMTLSLPTPYEVECAEKVKELFPFIEHMKFLKTGTEACMAAVRIARAHTGRIHVLSDGYHGWSDEFVCLTPPAIGTLHEPSMRRLNPHFLEQITENIAAVIIEPVVTDYSDERRAYLNRLRERCSKVGALLIFDEVITGFRFPRFSVSRWAGVTPDLICLGKAIANGFPLSVVGGREAIMNSSEYFVSSTFAGEVSALEAAKTCMTLLQTQCDIEKLWEKGAEWIERFNNIWPDKLKVIGYPTRGIFVGDELVKALFFQEACLAGILFGPSWFFNYAHLELDDGYFSTLEEIIWQIRCGKVTLKGKMPQSPFAQRARSS